MSKTKKIAILAIIAMVLTLMPTALFAATADSTRLEGAGRVETALDIASAGWTTAGTVVLAPADQANLVDALAAAPLAGQENAPILLTFKDSLDAAVKAKIAALGATKVYVVGAISDAVAAEVDAIANVNVEALKGSGRQATAAAVNSKLTSPAGTFVVGYDAIPDALSVASFAAKNKYAIVLANQDGSVGATLLGTQKYIVGGTAKVQDIAGVVRLSGADRYATNADVASKLSFSYDRIYVANGISLVDALAVAPLAAKYNAFVALASGSDVAASSVVNTKLSNTSKVIAVGGATAVPATVVGKVAYAAPAAFAVTGVETIGLKQIKVSFSKEADQTSAENEGNYVVAGAALTAANANAVLAADKLSAMVYLNAPQAQYAKVAFKVKDNVFAKDLVQKNAAYSADINFSDITIPTVASVKASGNKLVEVKFSEVVRIPAGYTTWKIDGQTISNFGYNGTTNTTGTQDAAWADVYKLNFGVALAAGAHTLTIPAGTVGSALDDAAGFKVAETTVDFTVETLTTKPSVVSIEASDNGAVYVTFDRKMNLTAAQTAGYYKINDGAIATATVKADSEDKVFKLTTNNALPIGANTVTFDYRLEDTYGNKIGSSSSDDVRMGFTVVKDTVKPTVSSVVMTTPTTIVVKFSESVNASYARNTANYTLKDSGGSTLTINGITGTTDTYTLTVAALSGSNYTLKIKNVIDLAATVNTMDEYLATFSGIDEVKPNVTKVYSQTDLQKVAVYFSEGMDSAAATVLSNYAYTDNANVVRSLPSGATVAVGETAKIVIITFPTSYTTNLAAGADDQYKIKGITVTQVKDLAGNLLDGVSQAVLVTAPAADAANGPGYVTNSFVLTADDSKVTAEFETTQTITTLDIADFRVVGQTPSSGYVVGKKVTLNFTGAAIAIIKRAGTGAVLSTAATNSKNSVGVPVKAIAGVNVYDDKIAPELVAITKGADAKKIIVQFSEGVDVTILGLYVDDFVVESNGQTHTVSSVDTPALTAVADDTFTLNLSTATAGAVTVKVASDATKISVKDKSNDIAETSNLYVPKATEKNTGTPLTDTFGPILLSVAANDNATVSAGVFDADDTFVFTFNEAVLATSIDAGLTAGGSITGNGVALLAKMGAFATPMVLAPATDGATCTLALSADGKVVTITTVGMAGNPGTDPAGAFTVLGTITDATAQAATGAPVATVNF